MEKLIDLELSLKYSMGNPILAQELLHAFIESIPLSQKILNDATNATAFKEEIHRLHGAACYVGIPALKECLEKIESTLTKTENNTQIPHFLNELNTLLNNIQDAYQKQNPFK